MWKYKEEYKLDKPETIGETDYTFDLDNYREWLEEQLTGCRKQLSIANVVGQGEKLMPICSVCGMTKHPIMGSHCKASNCPHEH